MRFGIRRPRLSNSVAGLLALLVGCSGIARGEESQEEIKGRIGYAIALVSPAGTYAYVPGHWGILHVHLVNPLNEPVNLLTATYFDGAPTLQYGRRLWMPARSRIKTWHPILLPAEASEGKNRYNFHTLVMQSDAEREVLIRSDSGFLQLDGALKTIEEHPVTGLVDRLGYEADADDSSAFDLVIATRMSQALKRQVTSLTEANCPPGEESLAALDQLVIGSSRALNDPAGVDAIRRWLYGGGKLWVMLDRVDPAFLERLLGDDFTGEIVDKVPLTHFTIETRTSTMSVNRVESEHETPVDFVRVLVDDVDVVSRINGWPATWWKTCGDGRLLVTTLGPRGWMKRRNPDGRAVRAFPRGPAATFSDERKPAPIEPGKGEPGQEEPGKDEPGKDVSAFVPIEPMGELAAEFYTKRPESLLPAALFEEEIQEFVGYSIPPRGLIISLLMGFGVLLAGAGSWLWRLGRLEWLGVIGTAAAVAVAGVLVWMGQTQRDAVPPTVASMQVVQAIPGTDDLRAEGFAGLYATDTGTTTISARKGGWFIPELTGTEGTTRRMIWTDLEDWRWENVPQSAGLRNARFREAGANPDRVEARATFGPEGLTGRLVIGDEHLPTDPMVVTQNGRLGVTLGADRSFTARAESVFSDEQYMAADFLSDEQNRRRRVLEQLLTNPQRLDYPQSPQLFFWTSPWDLGFRFHEEQREIGSALVTVPLRLERPADGTEVALSTPFLPFRAIHGPDDIAPSGMYNHRKRVWADKADPSTSWFRFQVPQVLLPVEMLGGRVTLQVTGPIGRVEVCGLRENKAVPLQTWMDPVGKLELDLTALDVLPISDDGGLLLRVSGGDPDRPELTRPGGDVTAKANYWKIESMKIDLRVKTVPPRDTPGSPLVAK